MLGVLVAVLLVLQGLVAVVAAGPAVASGYHTFVHCITGRADEAGTKSGALLFRGSCFQANHGDGAVAIIPSRIALILPARIGAGAPHGRIIALMLPRRTRLISEPRAPPLSV